MTQRDIFSGLKPVTQECFQIFAPFYQARAQRYVYPRYWQSVCFLICYGNVKYKIVKAHHGDVLCIFKSSHVFHLGVQMILCPISITGARNDEIDIIKACLKDGVSIRVCDEDIRRYGIPMKLLSENQGVVRIGKNLSSEIKFNVSDEFIYNAQKATAMSGSQYRKLRYRTKKMLSLEGVEIMTGAHPQSDRLVNLWDKRYWDLHEQKTEQILLWHICRDAPEGFVTIKNIMVNGTLQVLSSVEHLAPNHHIIIQRLRNYESTIYDVGAGVQYLDCSPFADRHNCYLNIGMGDTEGLIASKENLKPCKHLKIYNFKINKTNPNLKQYFV